MLAVHFNASDSHRMQEAGYLLILVAGVLLTLGSGVSIGRGNRSIAGILFIVAGALLFAAVRWGTA